VFNYGARGQEVDSAARELCRMEAEEDEGVPAIDLGEYSEDAVCIVFCCDAHGKP
jgi:hypothetical protein